MVSLCSIFSNDTRLYLFVCKKNNDSGACRDMVEYEMNIEIWGESNE